MPLHTDTLTAAELAPYIRRSVPTLERYRRLRIGPPFFRLNGRVLYSKADVDTWLDAQKQATSVQGVVH